MVLWAAETMAVYQCISAGGWLAGTVALLVSQAGPLGRGVICMCCFTALSRAASPPPRLLLQCSRLAHCTTAQIVVA